MLKDRKIIHVDMDAFFASVEQRDKPELQGRAVIVGGLPNSRGVVAACSYEARQYGVHSAMPSSRALRLCPDAVFVKPRFEAYRKVSSQLHNIFSKYTNLVEPLSLDEAYLDVSQCLLEKGSATLIAQSIKAEIKEHLNLVASAGVSYNKFLAKIASDMDKPDGLYVIRPEQAIEFIKTLPIRKFYGVGKVTESKMKKHKIATGADLAQLSQQELTSLFGKSGSYYFEIARGIDNRLVRTDRKRKSIGKETTFANDLTNLDKVNEHLHKLAERVGVILQQRELVGKTVTIKVKYHDFIQITRSFSPEQPVVHSDDIHLLLPELVKKTELGTRPCRLLGVSVSNFIDHSKVTSKQQALFN